MQQIIQLEDKPFNNQLLSVDKSILLKKTKEEKLDYVDKLNIFYPKMTDILKRIQKCQESPNHSKQPECLSLIGPRRAGKSTIIEYHQRAYPDIVQSEETTKPVLVSKVPCPAHIGSLVVRLLRDIGDPFFQKKDSIGRSTERLYKLLQYCKVELIVLDEVQHLVDRNRQILIQESADWFKDLIENTRIPVVFVGLPDSRKIFYENEQLGGRVLNRFEVGAFEFDDQTFRTILFLMDQSLPFKNSSGLANIDMCHRIHLATGGLLGFLKPLIKEATSIALENQLELLTMPILSAAYELKLTSIFGKNPFSPGFDLNSTLRKFMKK